MQTAEREDPGQSSAPVGAAGGVGGGLATLGAASEHPHCAGCQDQGSEQSGCKGAPTTEPTCVQCRLGTWGCTVSTWTQGGTHQAARCPPSPDVPEPPRPADAGGSRPRLPSPVSLNWFCSSCSPAPLPPWHLRGPSTPARGPRLWTSRCGRSLVMPRGGS